LECEVYGKGQKIRIKDVLTGKLSIPNADEEFDYNLDMGKKMLNAIEFNKVAYTELLLSIDVKISNKKIAFTIVKGCMSKDHPEGNAAITVVIWLEEFIVIIATSQDISSKVVSNSRKGTHDSTITTITLLVTVTTIIMIQKSTSHMIWLSQHHWMEKGFNMTFGFVIVVQAYTTRGNPFGNSNYGNGDPEKYESHDINLCLRWRIVAFKGV
jgi:hypothetical protein